MGSPAPATAFDRSAVQWHAEELSEVLSRLDSGAEGLSVLEAERRLAQDGPNSFDAAASNRWWPVLLRQFKSPLTAILLAAVVVSSAVGETLDAAAIGIIVVVNAALGFAQEWRADKAIEALQAMMTPRALVRRGGVPTEIDAALLVVGDLVELQAGDAVPADIRLLETAQLLVNEAALTGESGAVAKSPSAVPSESPLAERSSLAFYGTVVTAGWALGVIVATGSHSEFGAIVALTEHASIEGRQASPLQKTLAVLGRRLGEAALAIAALTAILGVLAGRPATEMFLTGVSLAVAVVPEGLPAVVTVTLALGLRAMARRNALLRRLEAAEALGAASVICTDKTGTLTQNRMAVRQVWTSDGLLSVPQASPAIRTAGDPTPVVAQLLDTAQICNHAALVPDGDGVVAVGDPTESALLLLARSLGAVASPQKVVHQIPFDSVTKMMCIVVRRANGELESHVKGAPEIILDRCVSMVAANGLVDLTSADRAEFIRTQERMADAGLRTLALARRELAIASMDCDRDLALLGLVGMHDPPRPEVPAAVATARNAGVEVVVMTGDAGRTALAIATEIGLPVSGTLTGPELDQLTDEELTEYLDGSYVLARVSPEHKLRVVRLLQTGGAVVAMTGDGVNDAPALQQASIGIAMGERGTDVARGAADLVLVDDNFASIVAAIEEGRRQYSNIKKFIRYLLSSNLGEVIAISGAIALGWPLILIPAQILWMNLMTDGVTALALGIERVEPDAMQQPPRRADESVLGLSGFLWVAGYGAFLGLVSLVVFRLSLGSAEGADLIRAQTLAFTVMVLLETVNVFNFRAERQSLVSVGWLSNPWLLAACGVAVVAQVLAVHLPGLSDALGTSGLTAVEWLGLGLLALPILLFGELAKWLLRRFR